LVGVLLFLFGLVSISAAKGDDSFGDTFVTASIAEPTNLIPFLASDSASRDISQLIFNGLLKYDKDLHLIGDLASSWEVKESGLKIIFHLKADVRWQDGKSFTARDVRFTFEKLTDRDTPTPYGGDFEKVKSLNIIDEHTIEVDYKEPFSPGLASWTMGVVPEHILKTESLLTTRFSRNPVGTGPYVLKKWKSGETIELVANKDYFEGVPLIPRYVYRIIPDQATIFLELQTENLDESGLTPLQFTKQTRSRFFETHYQKYRTPGFGYTYLAFNLENPLFSNKRVREAIELAIHKKEIIDVTLLGLGRVSTGPFLPDSWAYNHDVKLSDFNPGLAEKILKEAGWVRSGRDGILEKGGRKFSFTILTNQGNDQRKMACEIIQKELKTIGIDMRIQIVEWSAFLKEFIDKKRFDAVLLAWQLSPDPDIYDIFHSSKTAPGQFNFISYRNPEVDRLLEEGRRLFDEKDRARVYHRVHEILNEDKPYIFLYTSDGLEVVHKRFKGIEPAPAGIGYNFIHWYVPEDEIRYKTHK